MRNAINFTPEGGKIKLSSERTASGIHISVKDTGPGIPLEDQERMFQPFERAQSGQNAAKGSRGAGLGLSLVKTIVELQGGTVALESTAGQGTTVHIYLPD